MSRHALVLRPEPGNAATAARLTAAGWAPVLLPLFTVAPLPWMLPPGPHDALLLTSANAVRHAGPGLDRLRGLPVVAVGAATAAAAIEHGLSVAAVGKTDAVGALSLAQDHGWHRVLRLAGRDRTRLPGVVDVPVYANVAIDPPAGALRVASNGVALLHSARAAHRLAALIDRDRVARSTVRLAAISPSVAAAAGDGWHGIAVAASPTDVALVAAAATLAIDP